jgi:hypothetical protein
MSSKRVLKVGFPEHGKILSIYSIAKTTAVTWSVPLGSFYSKYRACHSGNRNHGNASAFGCYVQLNGKRFTPAKKYARIYNMFFWPGFRELVI